ncbi:MAG: DUF1062 domain-containing protein [Proteobacteria bacterium]|nr:DUF1062 domain-containing protein [Pseudomonadota bacterium]
METTLWRIRPHTVPVWALACARCGASWLESTGRFRVNANGRRHDVWLIYRCPGCGARRKQPVHRRVRADAAEVPLDAYRRDDPVLAESVAFALAPGVPVAYAVERPPLPESGPLRVRIVQPRFCAVRWDRFLAAELGWSRRRVQAAWRARTLCVEPACRASAPVRDGQCFSVLELRCRPSPSPPRSG